MSTIENSSPNIIDCELCVLGTGVAGLNALYAATHYLPKNTKVVVIDKNVEVGGMWQNTYRYVRLHQPYQLFTVGDIQWKLQNKSSYLASRTEIIDHLTDCYAKIKEHFDVVELFSSEFEQHIELTSCVEVRVRSNDQVIQINTKQFIKAKGLNVSPNAPFDMSSKKVVSCSPENMDLDRDPSAPIYIIGGGKTAMDTALECIRHNPKRPVHLIAGRGTWFIDREKLFAKGIQRYWKGVPFTKFAREIAEKFKGDNFEECLAFFKESNGISLQDDFQYFMFGILSQEENNTIREGLSGVITDYLMDVHDGENGPEIQFKKSDSMAVEEGAIFINCSGYLIKDMPVQEPYLSNGKRILSIQSTSSTLLFSTFDSYFLSHMFFRNKLVNSGLYAMNLYEVDKKCKSLVIYAACAQMIHNLLIYLEYLPLDKFAKCQLNVDLWYPKHRQIISLCQLLIKKKRLKQHCKEALDRFDEKYEVGCKPLFHSTEILTQLELERA